MRIFYSFIEEKFLLNPANKTEIYTINYRRQFSYKNRY